MSRRHRVTSRPSSGPGVAGWLPSPPPAPAATFAGCPVFGLRPQLVIDACAFGYVERGRRLGWDVFMNKSERRVVAVESELDDCRTILSDGMRPSSPIEASDMSKWLGTEGTSGPRPGDAASDRHDWLKTSSRDERQGF